MRQLAREGWMHNRARLIVAHFLCKTLYIDWREGAQHFVDLLVDGDVASNTMNWQWVAGTGTDSRFNRTYNVVLQARRHDPRGAYVRRYVEELAGLDDALPCTSRGCCPRTTARSSATRPPIVDQDELAPMRDPRTCAAGLRVPQHQFLISGGVPRITWARGCGVRLVSAAAAMLRAIPPKTMPWNGATAHQ